MSTTFEHESSSSRWWSRNWASAWSRIAPSASIESDQSPEETYAWATGMPASDSSETSPFISTTSSADPARRKSFWRILARFLGPGYMVAVGYMDPGNWATDIAGGARYGYDLLFAVALSSLIAILFQLLCIKVGVVLDRDLAEQCKRVFSKQVNIVLYIFAELAIMATDLAEVIGSAIALNLLFGLPLVWGVVLTALDVLLILNWWGKRYQHVYEAVIVVLVLIVAVCFFVQLAYTKPDGALIWKGLLPTSKVFRDAEMMFYAIAILGATVMPHNLYLHSSICKNRRILDLSTAGEQQVQVLPTRRSQEKMELDTCSVSEGDARTPPMYTPELEQDSEETFLIMPSTSQTSSISTATISTANRNTETAHRSIRMTLKFAGFDSLLALTLAFVINATILIVGASAFWARGTGEVKELQDAYYSLAKYVGSVAATLFAVALLVSGQSSTVTGTMAGQIVMSGYLHLQVNPAVRRLLTRLLAIVPALVTLLVAGETELNRLLVLSQVVLSFQLPFVVLPLVYFTSSKKYMGVFVNGWPLTILAWLCAFLVVALNICLIVMAALNIGP